MTNEEIVTPVIRKILNSMKKTENTSSVVQASYVDKIDPTFAERYPGKAFDKERPLLVDLNLRDLSKIEDLYRD